MIDYEYLESETLRIAQRKLSHASHEEIIQAPRLGTGGHYEGIFLWDTAFTCMWAKYYLNELPVTTSLDNLYRLQDEDGYIFREYSPDGKPEFPKYHPSSFAPPILSWAEWDLYEYCGDRNRIAKVYPHLKAFHRYCEANFKMEDGLYMGNHLGSGMDNLPRWPRDFKGEGDFIQLDPKDIYTDAARDWYCNGIHGSIEEKWNQQGRFIDFSAQMALDARMLLQMAELLGQEHDRHEFQCEYEDLAEVINAQCWSEAASFYFDLGFGKQVERFHIGAYWCLIAGLVPPERIDRFCSHLSDTKKFGRPVPVPSLAADDPDYNPVGEYWRGSSWAPTTYMVLKGLKHVGRDPLAETLAQQYVQASYDLLQETGTLWENIAPEQAAAGDWSGPDFCGWSGLSSVAIPREFLKQSVRRLPLHYCHSRSLEPEHAASLQDLSSFDRMHELGVSLFQVNATPSADIYTGVTTWIGPGQYDYSAMEAGWRRITERYPESQLCLRLYLGSPQWWDQAHLEELQQGANGEVEFDLRHTERRTVPSLASQVWRSELRTALIHFLQWLEQSGWSQRIWGFLLCSGITYEWGLLGGQHFPDDSQPMRQYFRDYLQSQYSDIDALRDAWGRVDLEWAAIKIPSAAERQMGTQGLRQFPRDRAAYDFQRCLSQVTGDCLLEAAGTIRSYGASHYQTGAFYGYTLTTREGQGGSVQAGAGGLAGGHHAFGRVLRSRLLDFIASPYAYANRDLGSGTLVPHFPWSSAQHHGLQVYMENDLWSLTNPRLDQNNPISVGNTENLVESIQHQRLAFVSALCRGESLWWFDLTEWKRTGDEVSNYSHPDIHAELKRQFTDYQRLFQGRGEGVSEIAIVIDEAAMDALALDSDLFLEEVYRSLEDWAWCGAPFDVWLAEDATVESMMSYKLVYLFAPAAAAEMNEQFATTFRNSQTTVWLAPGTTLPGDLGATRVIEKACAGLSPVEIADIAQEAGVHLYAEAPIQVWASSHLVAVHTRCAGACRINFPVNTQWREYFSGKIYREGMAHSQFDVLLFERVRA